MFLSSPALRRVLARYGEARWLISARGPQAPLFSSQKGSHVTPGSMARFMKYLYREARVASATSHSGQRALVTGLARRGVGLKAIAPVAGHSTNRTTAMYVGTQRGSPASCRKFRGDIDAPS